MQSLVFFTIVVAGTFLAFVFAGDEMPGRIVGGNDAPEGQYPYQVSLRRKFRHFCGGSIIDKRWILTAAHCIRKGNPESITVVVGTNSLTEGGQYYQADMLLPHPRYTHSFVSNDIGLIRVDENIDFDENVQPIKLPEEDVTKNGDLVTVTGWGSTWLGSSLPDRLQHIDLRVVSRRSCRRSHLIIVESHICVLTKKGEGACHGDSGGPLTANDVQIGVVSFGRPCARGHPDVFTRVSAFTDWIKESIEEYSRDR